MARRHCIGSGESRVGLLLYRGKIGLDWVGGAFVITFGRRCFKRALHSSESEYLDQGGHIYVNVMTTDNLYSVSEKRKRSNSSDIVS